MTHITNDNINEILKRHSHYMAQDVEYWQEYRAIFDGLDLSGADLSYKHIHNASFRNVDLTNANLNLAVFEDCDFTGAKFYNVNMNHIHFKYCNFSFASIAYSQMKNSILEHCTIRHMKFEDCDLEKSVITYCDLARVIFCNCNLNSAIWNNTHFNGTCNFYYCNMLNSNMRFIEGINYINFKDCNVIDPLEKTSKRSVLWNVCRHEYIKYLINKFMLSIHGVRY